MLDSQLLPTVLIGLLGGVAVGTQAPIAGAMSQRVGGAASSLVIHVGGTIASALVLLARGGELIGHWRSLPWYMLGSGTLGIVLYLTLSRTVPRLGAASALTLVVVGQLLVGMAIDHFDLLGLSQRPVDASRLAAMVLLVGGGYLMVR